MKKLNVVVFIILAFLVGVSCYRVFSLYFLNDELLLLGAVQGDGILVGYAHSKTLFDILLGNGRFLGGILNNISFYFFKDSAIPFAVFTLVIHTLNSYLAYLVAKKITKNDHIAFITACVFSVPATANQAISWFAATTQTLGGMTFVFLSILASVKGYTDKKRMWQIVAWIFAYIAFLFKESSFFVFPLLLLLPSFITVKAPRIQWKKYVYILTPLLILGGYKILQFFGIALNQLQNGESLLKIAKALFNMGFYPLVSLGQFFVPLRFMLRIAPAFSKFNYGFMENVAVDNPINSVLVGDLVSVILSFGFIIFMIYIYAKHKPFQKGMLFSLCWYILSFVPMAVFLNERNTSYVESRYLYFSFFPVAMMVGFFLTALRIKIETVMKNRVIAYMVVYSILAVFLYKQITLLQREINQNVLYGSGIKIAMSAIRGSYPTIPNKPIFYVEGDRDFFYPNNPLPFQLGTGYMLSLTFMSNPVIPKELFKESYLWHFFDQGYKEIGNKGFGYYWNKKDLVELFKTNKDISVDQLVGIYYYGNDQRVRDITSSITEYVLINQDK
ncbi:MAG: hypothetical protein WAV51_02885 [Microgenomates group bacterium]